jgi:hypothetical protein
MGQFHSSKVYIDPHNGNGNEYYLPQKSLEKQQQQLQLSPSSSHQQQQQQPNLTIIPIASFKNKLRVYQNFETNEVLVLLDSDINEFPGFTKSEAAEWYEVTISHLQEKYYNYFKTKEFESQETSALDRDKRVSQQQRNKQQPLVKKFTVPPSSPSPSSSSALKEKNLIDLQSSTAAPASSTAAAISSLRLNLSPQNLLSHSSSSGAGTSGGADRDKVDSLPLLQVPLAVPTHTISSLLTTPHNDSYSMENYEQRESEVCPFCKENLNEENGSKHICDCIVSHNIQEVFQESDKLLQEVSRVESSQAFVYSSPSSLTF